MVTLLTGPNSFLISQKASQIVEEFVSSFGAEAVERLNGAEIDPSQLGGILQGGSLFATRKLVIITDPSANKSLWASLEDWLPKIPAETHLLLLDPVADKRTKTYKFLSAARGVQEFADPDWRELSSWLQKTAKELGGNISSADAEYLAKRVGTGQWKLRNELEKLLNFDRNISRRSIDDLTQPAAQASAFDLMDAAMSGQVSDIDRLIEEVAYSEDPYKFMGLITSQILAIAIIKNSGGRPAAEIAKDSGLHPFVIRKNEHMVSQLSSGQVRKLVDLAAECDEALKTSAAEPWFLIGHCLRKISRQIQQYAFRSAKCSGVGEPDCRRGSPPPDSLPSRERFFEK